MINILFQEPDSEDWKAWRENCQYEQNKLNHSYACNEIIKVKNNLYKDRKTYYIDNNLSAPFYGKCAYCETNIVVGQPGDLDHYRPKNAVTVSYNLLKIKTQDSLEVVHPGYYWLAYDCKNLLPSCRNCNTPTFFNGLKIGKGNEFPVRDIRACKPGEESREKPLLLNPVDEYTDIEKHLLLGIDNSGDFTGIIKPLTEEAKITIDLLGLNIREPLIRDRNEAYIKGNEAPLKFLTAHIHKNNKSEDHPRNTIQGYIKGSLPYSAAGRAGLQAAKKELHADSLEILVRNFGSFFQDIPMSSTSPPSNSDAIIP